MMRRTWALLAVLAALYGQPVVAGPAAAGVADASSAPTASYARRQLRRRPLPRIGHVFIIVLENKDYADTFGSSTQDPYLQKSLVSQGALLTQYYGTGHVSLDNYLSLLSGQAPTRDTAWDCMPDFNAAAGNFNDVRQTGTAAFGQVVAAGGCVYPAGVHTLVDQLEDRGLSWKGYMEDMGNDPARESPTCGHPAIGEGTDHTNGAEPPSAAVPAGDAYATRHDPFVYFHSIIDSPRCQRSVVRLEALVQDLQRADTTPNFAFITPNLCNDGHDGAGTGVRGTTCANGQPGGLASADAFLKAWVPKILASPAYRRDGLLIITFDESNSAQHLDTNPQTGARTLTISFPGEPCCHQQPGPNLEGVRPGSMDFSVHGIAAKYQVLGYGGDRIGAVLLSPFIRPGTVSDTPYNHYALLRSLEDIYRLPYLGYAAEDPNQGYVLNTLLHDRALFAPGARTPVTATPAAAPVAVQAPAAPVGAKGPATPPAAKPPAGQ